MTAAELHAAVNDAAPALLAASALFDLGGMVFGRGALRDAAYWTLAAGLVGIALAIATGLAASTRIAHGEAIHLAMGGHRNLAYVAAAWWAVVGTWRLARPRLAGVALTLYVLLALTGSGLVFATAHRGGHLVFRLGAGVPVQVLEDALADIARGHEHAAGAEHDHDASAPDPGETGDSAAAGMPDEAPGTSAHQH